MLGRCENPSHHKFSTYGGRGITIWGPWHDVAVFIADVESEIGPRPDGRTPGGMPLWTLDRRDNDGNYEPGNIRWATLSQQNRNRQGADELARRRKLVRDLRDTGLTQQQIADIIGVERRIVQRDLRPRPPRSQPPSRE